MGLYLCIIADGEDLGGVSVGAYSDFYSFRSAVTELLESGKAGTQYPTLILHSDCDGQWSSNQCIALEKELEEIRLAFQALPPVEFSGGWQKNVAAEFGLKPQNLHESFIDVNGDPLIDSLLWLSQLAQKCGRPILFQ